MQNQVLSAVYTILLMVFNTINSCSLTSRWGCLVSPVRRGFPVRPALNSGQVSCCPAELHQVLFAKIPPSTWLCKHLKRLDHVSYLFGHQCVCVCFTFSLLVALWFSTSLSSLWISFIACNLTNTPNIMLITTDKHWLSKNKQNHIYSNALIMEVYAARHSPEMNKC